MPSFQYQSLTAGGKATSGTIAAETRAEALQMLVRRGETPTLLESAEGAPSAAKPRPRAPARAPGGAVLGRSGRPSLKKAEIANLIRELGTALEAGLPLMASLKTVRKQARGRGLCTILDYLIERVEAGAPLHQAAREYGPPFDDMIVGMLRAADASGEMSQIMHQLADLLERSIELRRSVVGAAIYPMIVAGLVVVSAIVLVTYLVPNLLAPLMGQIQLPLPTRIVLGVSDFLGAYGIWLFLALIAAFVGFRFWIREPQNRYLFDRMILGIPVYGRLVRDVAVARFTRTLGTLASAGLPILDSLRITRDTLGNHALMRAIDDVEDQVTTGRPLAEPLERSGMFPPLLVQIVNLGERSGKLESMLMHAANAFDRQVQNAVNIFKAVLPPVLIMIIASIGGFILAAILLPLLQLQNLIGG